MVSFGIQAAHEQINPTDLLNDVTMMDRYGIKTCWSSDHYMPGVPPGPHAVLPGLGLGQHLPRQIK
jgi:hypothetical protein